MHIARILATIVGLCGSMALFAQAVKRDTTFLLKTNATNQHAIFIEPNKYAPFYDDIADFFINGCCDPSYQNSLTALYDRHLQLGRVATADFPKQWIVLQQYKGRFYLYRPSDFYTHFQIGLTDTAWVDYTGEGPIANKILSFAKKNKCTYVFGLTGIYDTMRTITVQIINRQKGIAVFKEDANGLGPHYYLMVDARKRRQFPLIVNYCKTQKQREFNFDEPNFEQLLQKPSACND